MDISQLFTSLQGQQSQQGQSSLQTQVGAGVGLLGLSGSIAGGVISYGASQQANAAQMQEIGLQAQENQQRQSAMNLNARRQQMEVLRNTQRARSLALNNATGQGAQFGSGLQGGYGNIAGQSGVNALGISENQQIGNNMFGIQSQISGAQLNYAKAQQQEQLGSGISSLGKSVGGSAGSLSSLVGLFA